MLTADFGFPAVFGGIEIELADWRANEHGSYLPPPSPSGRGIEGEGEAFKSVDGFSILRPALDLRCLLPHPGPLPLGEGELPAALDEFNALD